MKENTKSAIMKYLLDDKMFSKIFLKKTLFRDEDHNELNTILHGLNEAKNIIEQNLWTAQMKVFYEKKYEEIKVFIPIILDDLQETKLFFELFIILHKYHNSINNYK